MLEVSHLTYARSSRTILNDVSLTVAEREFVALIGPNGAGKSTFLKHVAGVLPVSPGKVHLNGIDRAEIPPRCAARTIAYVPQSREPDIPFTTQEIVAQARYPFLSAWGGVTEHDRRRVAEAMALVGVRDLAGRIFSTLSGGEQQKVLIAAALAQDAKLLLLDEPTTFLDPAFQEEIFSLLEVARRENEISLLVVSHDINRVLVAADRIVALRDGAVVREGTPDEIAGEEPLEAIFGARFVLTPHPRCGRPMIVPRQNGRRGC